MELGSQALKINFILSRKNKNALIFMHHLISRSGCKIHTEADKAFFSDLLFIVTCCAIFQMFQMHSAKKK